MPGNIEIKARIKDIGSLRFKAKTLCFENSLLQQRDTFFASPTGCRLKLREEEDFKDGSTSVKSAFLIAYDRPDVPGAKFSDYVLSPVSEVETMKATLKMSNGMLGVVEKRRDVYLVTRKNMTARVHLDVVKELGNFLEFEVIVNNDTEMNEGRAFADWLSEQFGISEEDTLSGAYFNLMDAAAAGDAGEAGDE